LKSNFRKNVEKLLNGFRKFNTAYNFDPDSLVVIKHGDGTTYHFTNAYCKKVVCDGHDILFVFTEHNNYHWFFVGDLMEEDGLSIYKRIRKGII